MWKLGRFLRDVRVTLLRAALCECMAFAVYVSCAGGHDRAAEECVFRFETSSGKILSFSIGTLESGQYLVYRFGTDSTIELEFPSERKGSFENFIYSYYFRGGGAVNERLDLNRVTFRNGDYRYVVYEEHSASDSLSRVGVRVINEETGKEFEMKGRPESVKGSLVDFRFDDRIPK